MAPTWEILLAVLAPMLVGAATLALPRRWVGARVALALAGPAASLALLAHLLAGPGLGLRPPTVAWMPDLRLDLAFHLDPLGAFFALLVAGVGLLIVLYARAYFGPDRDSLYRFYPSLHLFMSAMLGVALADNLMLMLLFWEMTSISSFLLIGWERDDPAAVRKAMQAFIVTGAGGLALMGGLILLGTLSGAWSFTELLALRQAGGLPAGPLLTAAFALIFAGAAAKSAQWPLHFWLPGAMAAPTPVSAYLHSATMVKAGVYLTGRLWPIFALSLPLWPQLILPLGAITMVLGAAVALQKTDLKQIFAYTTVSQLGLLMTMYGLAAFEHHGHGGHAEANLIWDVTQILNHALYKAPLFILAGAIGHVASRELPELRGLFHKGGSERIMAAVLLLAAYALAAGPFTVSFTAKEMFFYQIDHARSALGGWSYPLIAAGVATGMFNVAIFLRLARVLLGRPVGPAMDHHPDPTPDHIGHDPHEHAGHPNHGEHHHERGLWPAFLWLPGLLLVAFQYVGGIVPGAYEALFGWLEATPGYFDHFPMTWQAHWGLPLGMSLAAMALGVGLGLVYPPLSPWALPDPHDRLYPAFYQGVTGLVGPRAFGLLQRGHAGFYVAAVGASIVGLFLWVTLAAVPLRWPAEAIVEPFGVLLPGFLLALLVCLAALVMPMVLGRSSRVLVLGTVGFAVTGIYYVYRAPDLALTQISIEIVSLVLFLLVLSLLPRVAPGRRLWMGCRLALAIPLGAVMFWLTLSSATAPRPPMPYTHADGQPYAHLGEFFLRNSHHGVDTRALPRSEVYGGVVPREAEGDDLAAQREAPPVMLHPGGGGNNVVNVILVDFRGFDTMGEITVLGLAVMGVWTLLRRKRGARSPKERVEAALATDPILPGAGAGAEADDLEPARAERNTRPLHAQDDRTAAHSLGGVG